MMWPVGTSSILPEHAGYTNRRASQAIVAFAIVADHVLADCRSIRIGRDMLRVEKQPCSPGRRTDPPLVDPASRPSVVPDHTCHEMHRSVADRRAKLVRRFD